MKRQFVRVIITANDSRGKAESWLKAAIENDLQAGESIFEFRETNLDSNGTEVE